MHSPTVSVAPIAGPTVEVPLALQYFLFLLAQLNVVTDMDERSAFEQWLTKSKKTTGSSILGRNQPTQPIAFSLIPMKSSSSFANQKTMSDQQQSPLFLAQERSVCEFVKLLVKTFSEAGFSISTESVIPANSAAIIADQSQAIKTLQKSFQEQEGVFRAQLQLVEAQLRQVNSVASFSATGGGGDGGMPSVASSAQLQTPDFSRNASVMSSGASGGAAGESSEVKLFAAKQEIAKLKNSGIVLQKDLAQSQRHVAELSQRVKENDDTIASLEIAFAALKTVHKNEKDDMERLDAMKETGSDAMVARLSKLTAIQGEQLLVAEESRSRTQRNHMQELDRILMAHNTLVAHLEEEIQNLRTTVTTMSQRNTELTAQQIEITGRQASMLAGLMKNNVEIVEKQYRPSNLVIHMTAEDRLRKESGSGNRHAMSSSSMVAPPALPHDERWNRSRLNGSHRHSSTSSDSIYASKVTASLAAAIRQFPLPSRPISSSTGVVAATARPRPQSSSLHRR
jgi:predicted nucleic-acid-binding protein